LVRRGFSLDTIYEFTHKQLEYFFTASQAVDAWDIDQQRMSSMVPYLDKESQKKLSRDVENMRNAFGKFIIKE
jgi:hypothetical protein